jgi:phosphonoacetaldehyde hydrolase
MKENDYKGPLKAVIFDWAGTTVDFGCFAPTGVFIEVFRRKGIDITVEQARGPMGMYKRDHILELTRLPEIAEAWEKKFGKGITSDDIDELFSDFIPLQLSVLEKHSDLVPELTDALNIIRTYDLKIGSTTGYNREMMQIVAETAARQGYIPDAMVCVSDVSAGRPAPWMAFRCAEMLNVFPMHSIVKIGDTIADVEEGKNAGMWSVGVIKSGNEMGLTSEEIQDMDIFELQERFATIRNKFLMAGADFVIESLADIGELISAINKKLANGEKP